jgi:hypothetical protein
MATIAENIQQVRQRIAAACAQAGRDVQSVTLLAVSKTFPAEAVREAIDAGLTRFGENYVQEGVEKIGALAGLRERLEWHLIGPLQSNKTRVVAEHFDWVHSVDRLKIAERLSAQRPPHLPPLQLCLQVNISGEATKSGVAPEAVRELALQESRTGRRCAGPAPSAPRAARAARRAEPRRAGAGHAVDGHDRRPGSGDPRGRHHRARGHRDLRQALTGRCRVRSAAWWCS